MTDKYINIYTYNSSPSNLNVLPPKRDWMKDSGAYNCPPMMMGNTLGWYMPLEESITLNWDGNAQPGSVKITFTKNGEQVPINIANNNFGSGVITFSVKGTPLFETPEGYSLLMSGPTNMWIDGIHSLTGIVETDWSAFPFPMNWKMSAIDTNVVIPSGYPVMCFIPINLSEIESFKINYKDIEKWEKYADVIKHQQSRPTVPHLDQEKVKEDLTHSSYLNGVSPSGKKLRDRNKILNLFK